MIVELTLAEAKSLIRPEPQGTKDPVREAAVTKVLTALKGCGFNG